MLDPLLGRPTPNLKLHNLPVRHVVQKCTKEELRITNKEEKVHYVCVVCVCVCVRGACVCVCVCVCVCAWCVSVSVCVQYVAGPSGLRFVPSRNPKPEPRRFLGISVRRQDGQKEGGEGWNKRISRARLHNCFARPNCEFAYPEVLCITIQLFRIFVLSRGS